MGSLPMFIALRTQFSTKRCLSVNKKDGRLGFDEDMVVNQTTQFGIERSSIDNQLVHIRCCYNNKYLVRESETSMSINATAEEKEEDTSVSSCTLFRPEVVQSSNKGYRFLHVQSGIYTGCFRSTRFELIPLDPIDGVYYSPLRVVMDMQDWDSLVVLPEKVVFKGDNDRYLGAVSHPTAWHPYALQFSKTDLGDATITHEIIYLPDGRVRIKSLSSELNFPSNANYWRVSAFTSPVNIGTNLTSFTPIKASQNSIALRHGGSATDPFCHRNPSENNYLYTNARTIVQQTRLQVEEPILSREVFNVKFRFQDARIYDEIPIVLSTAPATNTTQEEHFNTVIFRYTETRESSWRAFISLDLGVTMNFRSGIPIIGRLGFEISANFRGEYEWGETRTESFEWGQDYTFPIPPMTHVVSRLLATKGTCDIPFDYTVRDLLTDGTVRIHDVEGGVYTGVNNFNLHTHTDSQPLV